MDAMKAVGIVEGWIDAEDEDEVVLAWQYLIDTGRAWTLQGAVGRHAAALIQEGICTAPSGSY
ncbi:MAG: hypothetical protein EBT79_09785 [Actinobacteria bacterium]|nr:hypothetical protein [Actinomycetota bacterium]NBR67545.1 hypothetical protein [Actinomycetota bacterium]